MKKDWQVEVQRKHYVKFNVVKADYVESVDSKGHITWALVCWVNKFIIFKRIN